MTITNKSTASLAVFAASLACSSLCLAQITGTQRGWTYQFDVRQAEGRTDRLGLDFDVEYERQQEPTPPQLDSYGFTLRTKGFNAFDRATRDVNSLVGEVSLLGWHYSSALLDQGVLPPEQILELERLAEKKGNGDSLSPADEAHFNAFIDRASKGRRFFTYGGQFRLETAPDVNASQRSFGVMGAAEIPFLGQLLDALPASTRSGTRRSFPVRALLALDYVNPSSRSASNPTLLDSATWRARTEMAWSSIVLDRYILRATWEAHYFLGDKSTLHDRDRRFNNFLQTWVKVPLTPEMGVILKYLAGRAPPTYENSDIAALGFNISFFP